MASPRLLGESLAHKPMFSGLDPSKVTSVTPFGMNWDYLDRLRETWPRKLVIKGIVTREDAELAVEHGVDGIVVSNALGSGCLPTHDRLWILVTVSAESC